MNDVDDGVLLWFYMVISVICMMIYIVPRTYVYVFLRVISL